MKAWPAWTVFAKEWVDALRDRRTLAVVLLSSVLMGPLVLIALSGLVASFESRAERREVVLDGIENAPTLVIATTPAQASSVMRSPRRPTRSSSAAPPINMPRR